MENYRVLLVDDEEEIRAGISRKIKWGELGFDLVGEAENGAEALEIAEQLQPDLVLTDIQMPFMNGLELCQRLNIILPAAKMVVFSGFDEFEYARKAVGINISEYILKPINAVELSQVLTRLKEQLDTQRAQRRDIEALRNRYEDSLPLLKELFFTRLLDGRIRREQIEKRAQSYEIDLADGVWVTALIQVENGGDVSTINLDEALLLSVRAFSKNYFSLDGCTPHFILYMDRVAMVVHLSAEEEIYSFIQELNRLTALACSYLGVALTVGVGRTCADAHSLHESAREARAALDYRMLIRDTSVIYLGDIEPTNSVLLSFDQRDERELSGAIKLGSAAEVEAVIDGLIQRVDKGGFDLQQCQFFFLELMTYLVKLVRNGSIEPESVFGQEFTGMVNIGDFRSSKELGEWCCQCCQRLRELLGKQRHDSTGLMVERAQNYIAEHYAQSDLNVDTLCSHLHLSPAYFSTLFKREVGVSFTTYVTNVRMGVATDLLHDTDDKTYQIADKIGYVDPNYFSYVFKRHFGMSPSKYRGSLSSEKTQTQS